MPDGETHDSSYPWYSLIQPSEAIEQGDFFLDLQVMSVVPTQSNPLQGLQENAILEQRSTSKIADCVVLTHSCDFQEDTPSDYQVVVCPFFEVEKDDAQNFKYIGKDKWESYVAGRKNEFYLLNEFQTPEAVENELNFFYRVVELKTTYVIPYGVLLSIANTRRRVRLLPPYREHLSQAFAKRFMRVGLPVNIPSERPY